LLKRCGAERAGDSPLERLASGAWPHGCSDESEAIRSVHAALDLGINCFDVAPAYGGTRAEAVLGKALEDAPK
jgi:aryl-alcohol dehydrogenase-like predicted oxidoreductase